MTCDADNIGLINHIQACLFECKSYEITVTSGQSPPKLLRDSKDLHRNKLTNCHQCQEPGNLGIATGCIKLHLDACAQKHPLVFLWAEKDSPTL